MSGPLLDPAARPIVDALGLRPNPLGGWFRQVHEARPPSGTGRALATVINYLLDAAHPAAFFHRMSADAVHFFHQGCPLMVLTISDDGDLHRVVLGPDPGAGHQLQVIVPGGRWKAFELLGGPWALISEAVTPGWEPADQEEATAGDFPHLADIVARFVR